MSDFLIKQKKNRSTESTTFLIHVLFRQNSSWQGELCWIESGRTINFRSLLEMLMLMEEAMDKSCIPQVEYNLRTWNRKATNSKNL